MAFTAAEKNLINELVTITIDNQLKVNITESIVTNFILCFYPKLEKCEIFNCRKAITIENDYINIKMCDYHAARTITRATKEITGDASDGLNSIREALARIELWHDIQNANAIRMIEDFYQLTQDDSLKQ